MTEVGKSPSSRASAMFSLSWMSGSAPLWCDSDMTVDSVSKKKTSVCLCSSPSMPRKINFRTPWVAIYMQELLDMSIIHIWNEYILHCQVTTLFRGLLGPQGVPHKPSPQVVYHWCTPRADCTYNISCNCSVLSLQLTFIIIAQL